MPQSRENTSCVRWEALLADAVDGEMRSGDEAEFGAHMAACEECAALFDAARKGREWLEFLTTEPEMPAGMLEKILARTGPGHEAVYPEAVAAGGIGSGIPEPWQRPGLGGLIRRIAEPRLMLTAAMAFFSTAVTLSLMAPRVANMMAPAVATVKVGSLRPALVRAYVERQFADASVPIVRYYDHLQLVNQVQSTVKEIKRAQEGTGAGESASPSQQPAGTGALRGTPKPKSGPRRTGPAQQVEAAEVAPEEMDPTLATKTNTSRGWGTQEALATKTNTSRGWGAQEALATKTTTSEGWGAQVALATKTTTSREWGTNEEALLRGNLQPGSQPGSQLRSQPGPQLEQMGSSAKMRGKRSKSWIA